MTIDSRKTVSVSASAQNTFTSSIALRGKADLSISGRTDSTITLQRSFDAGANWRDIEQFTADAEKLIEASHQPNVIYRLGIKTGDYVSDTVLCEISQFRDNKN